MAKRRINKDIDELQNNPMKNIEVKPSKIGIFQWEAFITGPQDSPYKGHVYKVIIKLLKDYPPKVKIFNLYV